jgi:hypothetical protein
MRYLGLIGLVLALLVAGVLVSRQMKGSVVPLPPGTAASAPMGVASARRLEEEVKRSLDEAMQKARPMPEEP